MKRWIAPLVALTLAGLVAVAGVFADVSGPARSPARATISHISSVVHISASSPLPVTVGGGVASNQMGAWAVTAHQGGSWTVSHVSSVLHAALVGGLASVNQMGAWSMTAHAGTGSLTVNQGGAWSLTAHQGGGWNTDHISSVTHIAAAGPLPVVQSIQSALWNVTAHQGGVSWTMSQGPAGNFKWPVDAHIASGSVNQGTAGNFAWPVAAHIQTGFVQQGPAGSARWPVDAHQAGSWTVAHVSSVSHVIGSLQLISQAGVVATFTGSSLNVAGVLQQGAAGSARWPIDAHQAGAWNVDKVSHITSAMVHVQGTVTIEGRGTAGSAAGGVVTVQGVTSMTPVLVNQGNAQFTVAHISSTVHVAGTVTANPATAMGKTITYVSVNQVGAGTTELAAASVGNNHKILGAILTLSLAGTMKFTDGVADLTGPMDVAATGGFVLTTSAIPYQVTGATNRALNLVTATGAARGVVIILTEP